MTGISFKPNPALQELEFFIGNWKMELSNTSFLPDRSAVAEGYVSFELLEDGAYIVMSQESKLPGPPVATWLISRDESVENYAIFYYDSRGVSRIYEMSLSNKVWKIWRNSPGFSQRFEGRISNDDNTVTAQWEKSFDGVSWEHDFDMKYNRINH